MIRFRIPYIKHDSALLSGLYIFTLFDNHSATYSALMLGAAEITVMAWVYGADKFMEDLHTMLGFYPFPRIFWLLSWKLVSPALLMVMSVLSRHGCNIL